MSGKNHILYLTAIALFIAAPALSQDRQVCIGSKVMYAANGLAGSIYEFNLDQPYAGEIIKTAYRDTVIVQWGETKGIFQLGVREISQIGCIGNWAYLNVEVVGEYAQFAQPVYSMCANSGVYVDFNKSDFAAWSWTDPGVSADGYIAKPGRYELITIDHNNCRLSSFVDVLPKAAVNVSLGPDTAHCTPDFTLYALNTQNNPTETVYTWSTGESGVGVRQITVDDHDVDQAVKYWVRAEYDGCAVSDTITILACRENLKVPNTFTPNGDGENDVWNIWTLVDYPDCVVEVFDRWGRRVFNSPRGYPTPWDGRDASGRVLPMETYYYIIHLNDGVREPQVGNVTIIR